MLIQNAINMILAMSLFTVGALLGALVVAIVAGLPGYPEDSE